MEPVICEHKWKYRMGEERDFHDGGMSIETVWWFECELCGKDITTEEIEYGLNKVAQLETENERLRKIEVAAKAIDAEWFIDYEECPEEVRALHKALGGES